MATSAFAGAISSDTSAYLGALNCNTSQSSSGTGSAAAASVCGNPWLVTSTASGSFYPNPAGLFPSIQASADVQAVSSPLLSDTGAASVEASYTESLLITGGTGSGDLVVDFSITGEGGESGPMTGGSMSGSIGGGTAAASFSNPAWTCGADEVCSWALDGNPAQYLAIPFTFGVPFSFSEELNLNAEAADNGSTGVSATLAISGFSVLDSNGSPVSGAQVSDPIDAPEPGSWILCGGILGLATELVRRRRFSSQARRG